MHLATLAVGKGTGSSLRKNSIFLKNLFVKIIMKEFEGMVLVNDLKYSFYSNRGHSKNFVNLRTFIFHSWVRKIK
jgi:hypothetical protein